MIIEELQRALLQIIAFTIIPLVWWFIGRRRYRISFFKWIGLKKINVSNKKHFLIFMIFAFIVSVSMSLILDPLLPDDIQLANTRFGGQGMNAFIPAIIFSIFATGLPEEILFRGFIGKRLSERFGFLIGNTIQSSIFGLLHGATLFSSLGIAVPLLVIVYTAALGWLMGYVNRQASDSILPSWCLHGIANIYASVIIMFELL